VQLKVTLSDSQGTIEGEEFTVHTFTDADRIGQRVGRVVRDHIRNTPVRGSLHRTSFLVSAWWTETPDKHTHTNAAVLEEPPRPKRKKKARK
jgi:hypothetical protein